MIAKPTFKQLKYLCAVAEAMHFGKAASTCHVTQSTLSAGIQELENTLGIALLERTNKSVLLTDAGKRVVDRSLSILAEIEALTEESYSATQPLHSRIRLGVIPTIAPFVLPQVLSTLRSTFPALQLLIREDLSANLVKLLQQGELDLILLALPYHMTNVTTHELFIDPFVAAYPSGHPLEQLDKITTKDLKGHEMLLLEEGHCLRDHALAACKLTQHQVSLSFEATSLHTIVPMVANGIGITLLPKMAIDAGILTGISNVKTKEFAENGVWRSIGLAWRRRSPREEEYKMLAEYFSRPASNLKCNTLREVKCCDGKELQPVEL
ncbi:MAG: hydrogen peroxide-inducible genes activator [Porticoccaceae bacterium]